jgi:hypothetical protein
MSSTSARIPSMVTGEGCVSEAYRGFVTGICSWMRRYSSTSASISLRAAVIGSGFRSVAGGYGVRPRGIHRGGNYRRGMARGKARTARVIRTLDEGDTIRDAATYCHNVARLVLLEALKERVDQRALIGEHYRHARFPCTEPRLLCLVPCALCLVPCALCLVPCALSCALSLSPCALSCALRLVPCALSCALCLVPCALK